MIDWGEHHREWLERTIGATLEPTAQFLANSEPYGVVGFERYTGDDVEVHVAGERGFLTRRFLRALAHYAFNDLGCARVTGRVPDFRPASLDVGLRLGFRHEGTLRRAHKGADFHILGMLREECRWLPQDRP